MASPGNPSRRDRLSSLASSTTPLLGDPQHRDGDGSPRWRFSVLDPRRIFTRHRSSLVYTAMDIPNYAKVAQEEESSSMDASLVDRPDDGDGDGNGNGDGEVLAGSSVRDQLSRILEQSAAAPTLSARPSRPLRSSTSRSDTAVEGDLNWRRRYRKIVRALKRGGSTRARRQELATSADNRTQASQHQKFVRPGRIKDAHLLRQRVRIVGQLPALELPAPIKPIVSLTPRHHAPPSHADFRTMLSLVREAIALGVYPQRLQLGSSGSYVCSAPSDVSGPNAGSKPRIVAVFKPQDEEPYAINNPKLMKRIQRLLFPCTFGRSCLVPNVGYASESAAAYFSHRLGLDVVPPTEVVSLAAPTFHYPKKVVKEYQKRQTQTRLESSGADALPVKDGSLQQWVHGYVNATDFFAKHPYVSGEFEGDGDAPSQANDDREDPQDFQWTPRTRLQFREELERVIVLDYLMRNTDRSTDNWMIRICKDSTVYVPPAPMAASWTTQPTVRMRTTSLDGMYNRRTFSQTSSVPGIESLAVAMEVGLAAGGPTEDESNRSAEEGYNSDLSSAGSIDFGFASVGDLRILAASTENPACASGALLSDSTTCNSLAGAWHTHIMAIDHGLAFPFKHPDHFRSYPFGWLWLPSELLDRPFSPTLRSHMLPLLTDERWWRGTLAGTRRRFRQVDEETWQHMVSVIKGQAWNLIECLQSANEGPIELCRRQAVVVRLPERTGQAGQEADNDSSSGSSNEEGRRLEEGEVRRHAQRGRGKRLWRKLQVRLHNVRPWFFCC